jgi:nitrogen fixation protein FixH
MFMKTVFFGLVLALGLMTAAAAEHTWTGKISDSMCGANHQKGAEHGAMAMSDHDCTLACVKNGAKFVFVSGGKVYKIENQDFANLTEHAGHTVQLKGDLKGDTIMVSSIEMKK